MPAQQGQRCLQIDFTTKAQQGQSGLCDKGTNVSAPRAITPVWQGQQHQRNCTKMPARGGQQCWCNNSDGAHATWGQRDQRNKNNNAGATRATTLVQCWQWCQHNKGNNAMWQWQRCLRIDYGNDAIMTRATTPAWWRQQRHHNEGNNVIAMMAKTPGLQRCLRIDDSSTIATRETPSAQWQQRCLHINNGKDPIVTRATTPAWWLR